MRWMFVQCSTFVTVNVEMRTSNIQHRTSNVERGPEQAPHPGPLPTSTQGEGERGAHQWVRFVWAHFCGPPFVSNDARLRPRARSNSSTYRLAKHASAEKQANLN